MPVSVQDHGMRWVLRRLIFGVCLLLMGSAAQQEILARVIVNRLVVYDHYWLDGDAVAIYEQGTELRVLGREDAPGNGGVWVYVIPQAGGAAGWVLSAYLDFGTAIDLSALPVVDGSSTSTPQLYVLPALTRETVRLWTQPEPERQFLFDVPPNTALQVIGRNHSGTWLQVELDGVVGWVTRTFIQAAGDTAVLSITQPQSAEDAAIAAAGGYFPVQFAGVVSNIHASTREIFQHGQSLGNDPQIFSKIGDSITASRLFFSQIGQGAVQLGDYEYLRPSMSYFLAGRIGPNNPFSHASLAARTAWRSDDLLDPALRTQGVCLAGESPLVCEYRVSRSAVALIMIGTNDLAQVSTTDYRRNLETIVEISIAWGVIPVLSTLPDRLNSPTSGRVILFNDIIRDVSLEYDVPLWEYWGALQTLPNWGISIDSIHPSYPEDMATATFTPQGLRYGYTLRNLTGLMVLDALWRQILTIP